MKARWHLIIVWFTFHQWFANWAWHEAEARYYRYWLSILPQSPKPVHVYITVINHQRRGAGGEAAVFTLLLLFITCWQCLALINCSTVLECLLCARHILDVSNFSSNEEINGRKGGKKTLASLHCGLLVCFLEKELVFLRKMAVLVWAYQRGRISTHRVYLKERNRGRFFRNPCKKLKDTENNRGKNRTLGVKKRRWPWPCRSLLPEESCF